MKRPTVTIKAVATPRALDEVLLRSKKQRQLSKVVLKWQRRLRRAVDAEAWQVYLRLEEAVNDRAAHEHALLVAWALSEGFRRPS